MHIAIPEVSKQISSENIRQVIEKNYVSIIPVWAPLQLAWLNNAYKTFHDYEKFMIIMHLLKKTLDAYSKNFVKLNYDEYFNLNKIEIETINITEISKFLNVPKETARRKVNELEKLGSIKRIKKKIIIDKETWPNIIPQETLKKMTGFLSILSKMVCNDGLISKPISSEKLMETCKEYFSYIWKLYYEMQLPWLLDFKKVYGDLESFHVGGIVLSNHALDSKKIDNSEMSKKFYLDKYFFTQQKGFVGINTMSISDITGIPRATVFRKLNKLVKEKFITKDNKKRYSSTGIHKEKILKVQKNTLTNLSILASSVYNLSLIKSN